MTDTHVARWYCCLNSAERTAVQVCASNAGPITYFVAKPLFDACWLLAFEGSASIRRENFIANFGLIEGSVPPEDPEGIQVFYMPPEIWDDINAYLDEHGTSCDDECKVLTFSS